MEILLPEIHESPLPFSNTESCLIYFGFLCAVCIPYQTRKR